MYALDLSPLSRRQKITIVEPEILSDLYIHNYSKIVDKHASCLGTLDSQQECTYEHHEWQPHTNDE